MECTWTFDDIDDTWETSCGKAFMLNDGIPSENDMLFCCYCGKMLKEEIPLDEREAKDFGDSVGESR